MDEIDFGKGAVIDKVDDRDYQFSDAVIALGILPFDWEKGYDIEEVIGRKLVIKNQGNSGSCGGQAWGYYGQVLDPDHEEKSAKFIYSHTFVKPAGSAGRTNSEYVINYGWGGENLTSSYNNGLPPTEEFMQKVSDINSEAYKEAILDKGLSYSNVAINIDIVAQSIETNKGSIMGITGKNNGTWLSKFPQKPNVIDKDCWNHWMYLGKAKLIDGKKYIGAPNSWGDQVGENGWQWFGEEYFTYPNIWSIWNMMYDFPKPKYKFTKLLKKGSKEKEEIKQLQMKLNIEIKSGLKVDGDFGVKTDRAVKNYQKAHNLKVDGLVGPKTRAELNK